MPNKRSSASDEIWMHHFFLWNYHNPLISLHHGVHKIQCDKREKNASKYVNFRLGKSKIPLLPDYKCTEKITKKIYIYRGKYIKEQ